MTAASQRRRKGFFRSLTKRQSKSSHSGQHVPDRDATSNIDVDGQDGNKKRRKRRRWGRKTRSRRYDDSDMSPLISSSSSEDELEEEEEESVLLVQAHVRGRRGSRKMGGVDD